MGGVGVEGGPHPVRVEQVRRLLLCGGVGLALRGAAASEGL